MARDFTSTDVVNYGSSASVDGPPDNAGTAIVWVFPDASNAGTWLAKNANTFLFNPTATQLQITHARGTQSMVAITNFASASTYGNTKWCFVAATWDLAGANGDQQIWHGDLSTIVAETGAYTTQRVGSGTVTSSAASDLRLGNRDSGAAALDGKCAFVGLWNRRLPIGELKAQQFRPHMTSGCVLFSWVGFSSPEADWSGNQNAGTVTGTTVTPNVPLPALVSIA